MNKLEQAARQALEALEAITYRIERDLEHDHDWAVVERELANEAIAALRKALEAAHQPAAVGQEPVAFLHPKYGHMQRNTEHIAAAGIDYVGAGWLPLYAAPQPAPFQRDW